MRNLINILDLTTEEIDEIVDLGTDIYKNPDNYKDACRGKIMGSLFFEPSTRTRLSFTSAMMGLGGNVLGFSQAGNSSIAKGETVSDTVRMVDAYSDIIVMRHPKEGAPIVASNVVNVPLINAGDGGHFHPTQTLTDLITIKHKKGRFDNLTIGVCGDLKYGRTVHSLISAMVRYPNVRFVLISPDELALPNYIKDDFLYPYGVEFAETDNLEAAIPSLDILYMTRIQAERFESREQYERLKDSYILTKSKLYYAKPDLSIMHPLPRVNEIHTDVDEDERAHYFIQAELGRYVRMALIIKLLETRGVDDRRMFGAERDDIVCKNPHCISRSERGVRNLFIGEKCIYCDQNGCEK